MKRLILILTALIALIAMNGCDLLNQAADQTNEEGDATIQASLTQLTNQDTTIASVQAEITHSSGTTLTEELTRSDDSASGVFEGIAEGEWSVTIRAYDSSDNVIGTGTGVLNVSAGDNSSFSVTLEPGSGSDSTETGGTGTIEGTVRDATDFSGIGGVTVAVEGTENTTTSASDGSFTISAPSGTQTVTFSLEGYSFPEITVDVTAGQTVELNEGRTVASPNVGSGDVRIVLTWGVTPSDLDSHLLTPSGEEVYWVNTDPPEAGANLDTDDTSSYGPETITITDPQQGTYQYWVYQYSSTGSLTSSEAVVELYDSTGLFQTYTVPTSGSGRYWHVVTMQYNGSQFLVTDVDQIQSTEPSS